MLSAIDPAQGAEVGPHNQFVLAHSYEPGDVVLWDNYTLWHRAPPQIMLASPSDPSARFLCKHTKLVTLLRNSCVRMSVVWLRSGWMLLN